MTLRMLLIGLVATALVGCADTMTDEGGTDPRDEQSEQSTSGNTGAGSEKADRFGSRGRHDRVQRGAIDWTRSESVELEGQKPSHSGQVDWVSRHTNTRGKVTRVSSEVLAFQIDSSKDYPVVVSIEEGRWAADGGAFPAELDKSLGFLVFEHKWKPLTQTTDEGEEVVRFQEIEIGESSIKTEYGEMENNLNDDIPLRIAVYPMDIESANAPASGHFEYDVNLECGYAGLTCKR